MSKIKLSQLNGRQNRIVRETTAPFTYISESGEQLTEPFRVRFYSLSTAEQQAQREKIVESDAAGGAAYWSDILLPVIESFPDLIGDDGLPVPVTKELLDQLNGINLQSIYQAIREAPLPKLQAAK